MPTQRQSMLIDTIKTTQQKKGRSDTARLKSAYGSHPDSVMVSNAAISLETGAGAEAKPVTLHQTTYRAAYEAFVKSGKKHIPGSYFPEAEKSAASMDYDGAPKLGTDGPTPEGEAKPGEAGSSIVGSGLGPNVNIHGTLGPGGTRANVDGSTSPSSAVIDPYHSDDGSKTPHDQSVLIASETSIPPGSLGHSVGGAE